MYKAYRRGPSWETAPDGDGECACGEILPDLSRKVYSICYHRFFFEYLRKQDARVDARNHRTKQEKRGGGWPLKAFFLTIALSVVISFFSETTMLGVSLPVAVAVLLFIICIGIAFDIIGTAVAVQDVTDFTAMASKRIHGARRAIRLVQRADRVANICNDVVGDICGIVSGAMGAAIAGRLLLSGGSGGELLVGIAVSSLIAGVTVGGKAAGKRYALQNSRSVVFLVARLLSIFDKT